MVKAGNNLAPEDIKWFSSTGQYLFINDNTIECRRIIKESLSDKSRQSEAGVELKFIECEQIIKEYIRDKSREREASAELQ